MDDVRRMVVGGAAVVVLVFMAVLFWKGPSFTTSGKDAAKVEVSCGSIAAVGWPSDHSYLDSASSATYGDRSDLPDMTADDAGPARAGIARDCSERRDTYLGFMTLLGPLAALLGALAIAAPWRGGARSRDQSAEAESSTARVRPGRR